MYDCMANRKDSFMEIENNKVEDMWLDILSSLYMQKSALPILL